MRAGIHDLPTPVPLAELLPSVLQEDVFVQGLCSGLDNVLAPALATLDCLDAYLDPATTPEDFLPWLANWVGLVTNERLSLEQQRAAIAGAVAMYRLRGTATGLRKELAMLTGTNVQVAESGGVTWSQAAGAAVVHSDGPARLVVRVIVDETSTLDVEAVDAVIAASKPAHVVHSVEVVNTGDNGG